MCGKKFLKGALWGIGVLVSMLVGLVAWGAICTEKTIESFGATVEEMGRNAPFDTASLQEWKVLPPPVTRFFAYVFPNGPRMVDSVRVEMAGQFRRPRTESFAATTASQVMAARTPAFVFAATTPIVPGIWARAYDFFAQGKMEMRAKIVSTLSVVDEKETPELNETSLRRWLLESSLCPSALLPGGPVRWEPIDDRHARATVSGFGIEVSLVASFRDDDSLESFRAERDGDLSKPYHGSGELVTRSDYQLVDGMRIPRSFSISRVSGGKVFPFWVGRVVSVNFLGVRAHVGGDRDAVSDAGR